MNDESFDCVTEINKRTIINRSAFKKLTISQSTKKRKHVSPIISPNSSKSIEKSHTDQLDEIRAIVNIIDPIIPSARKISSLATLNPANFNEIVSISRCMKNQNVNTNETVINKVSRKRINFDENIINEVKDNEFDLAPVDLFLNKENDRVSFSSGDDFKPSQKSQKKVINANVKRKTITETKEKEKKKDDKEIERPSTAKSKLDKKLAVISQSCHKIDSFFTPSTKDSRILNEFYTPCTSQYAKINRIKPHTDNKIKYEIGVPINRMQKIDIKRKLTNNTNLTRISQKYFSNDQKRIPNFFLQRKDDSLIGYYTTVKNSLYPIIITGDLDISKFLTVLINNEEENTVLNKFEIIDDKKCIIISPKQQLDLTMFENIDTKLTQQKINEKIVHFENFMSINTETDMHTEMKHYEVNDSPNKSDCEIVNTVNDIIEILDSDDPDKNDSSNVLKELDVENKKKLTKQSKLKISTKIIKKKSKTVTTKRKRKTITCPEYKIIAGTSFAVDAFRFGYIEGVTEYFLTHFHADHYIGLTKGFNKPIYLSEITARLVRCFIKTSDEYLHIIEINKPIIIKNIEITALDANHCPGAIVLIFKFPDGKCILHTGDFRATPEMEEEPFYWNNNIDTVYLDTTYLSTKYDFQSQWDSIKFILDHIGDYVQKNIGNKFLIICGSYLIGKEKVWLNIATKFNFKVWLEPKRRQAVNCINDEMMAKVIVDEPENANIHVLTMGNMNYDYLIEYRKQFDDVFSNIIAIRPSGWEKNSKPQYRGIITIIGVEYSEHSSYNELKRFIRFLRPNNVISTVRYGSNITKTPKIPSNWMLQEIKPMVEGYQTSITNYIKMSNTKSLQATANEGNNIDLRKACDNQLTKLNVSGINNF